MSEANHNAQRTESTDSLSLSATIQSAVELAVQVNDSLHDVSSRASQLDLMSDEVINVIGDSSRHYIAHIHSEIIDFHF